MKARKQMPRTVSRVLLTICLIALVLGTVSGGAFSKYRMAVQMTDRITVVNRLADSFVLMEHKAEAQEDGTYSLMEETTTADTRYLIPGTVIPMDPYVSITGKTSVDSYLYVEVLEENLTDAVSYELTEDWKKLESVTGSHGGTVYVYQNGAKLNDQTDPASLREISILKDNEIRLGEKPIENARVMLKFCGYLIQASGDQSPEELFAARVPKNS